MTKYFVMLAGDDFYVSPHSPVQVDRSQPNPDFAIIRLPEGKAPGEMPRPEDCVLVVEVADSSVGFDRKVKSRAYAEAGIPEYWILDLPRNCVVVHRLPQAGRYREVVEYGAESSFQSPALLGRTIVVGDLLTA